MESSILRNWTSYKIVAKSLWIVGGKNSEVPVKGGKSEHLKNLLLLYLIIPLMTLTYIASVVYLHLCSEMVTWAAAVRALHQIPWGFWEKSGEKFQQYKESKNTRVELIKT